MNAERLLEHYEQIADAPDAIGQLRRFILDLAVRGKLVPQDPKDEPASELLHRINKAKAHLVRVSSVRKPRELGNDHDLAEPFAVPQTWRWVRFADIASFASGRTPSRSESSYWNNGDYAWASIADMQDGQILSATKETVTNKARERVFRLEPEAPGTIIMSFKLTIGKIARLGIPAFHNEAIISIRPYLSDLDAYVFMAIPMFARQGDIKGAIKGATLNRDSLSTILLPLPPLAEQHRIVAKVDELMALCDRLEAARAERESRRDRLTAASLARLNAPNPDTFTADARFVLNALPNLTTRQEHVANLSDTILDLAMCGKLVLPGNDGDCDKYPAKVSTKPSTSYESRADATSTQRRIEGVPCPAGWALVRGALLANFVDPQPSHRTPPEHHGGVPYVGYSDISSDGTFDFVNARKVDPKVLDEHRRRYTLRTGDFVIGKIGTIGKPFLLPEPFNYTLSANLILVQPNLSVVLPSFLVAFFRCPKTVKELQRQSTDSTHSVFGIKKARDLYIPVPPLDEQRRIVAKVEELRTFCRKLEVNLVIANQVRSHLLDSLLAEALAPDESREYEAAE